MMKFPYGKKIFQTTNQNFGIMNIGGLPSQQLDTKKAKKCEQWLDFEVVIQFEHIDKLYIHWIPKISIFLSSPVGQVHS